MKAVLFISCIFLLLLTSSAHAGGGCPRTADNLEAFAGCMVPLRGYEGTMYRGTLADLNGDSHMALMSAMHSGPVVPPQVVPVPGFGAWSPMVAAAAYQAGRSGSHNNAWNWYLMGSMFPAVYYPW